MYKIVFIIGLLLVAFTVKAQHNYKQIDSLSYDLYVKKEWKQLAHFGETIQKENFNFYFLNLRLGIANYNLKSYSKAIAYFEKSLHNDSTSQVAIEYLFWCYYLEGNYREADFYYHKLNKKQQGMIDYKPFKILDFVYFESGINFEQKKKQNNNLATPKRSLLFLNLGINLNINHDLKLYTAYYFQDLKSSFNDNELHRFFSELTYSWPKNYSIRLGLNYIYAHDKINSSNTYTSDFTDKIENGYVSVIGVTKLFDKFKVNPFTGIVYTNTNYTQNGTENVMSLYEGEEVSNEDFNIDTEENNSSYSEKLQYYYGLNCGYDLTRKLGVGFEFSTDFDSYNYIPSIKYKVNNSVVLISEFIMKDKSPLYFYNGLQLLNTNDKMQRISLLSKINITNKLNLYIILQHNNVKFEDKYSRSNTALLGLKTNF